MRLLIISVLLLLLLPCLKSVRKPVMCLQCGGDKYEGSVRLSRDECCNATPVVCLQGHVCLRALVHSPYGNFFLSGCHPEEDHLVGCDFHHLPHNSSVHRCVCKDADCQNNFPGDCPIKGITDGTVESPTMTTTSTSSSTTPPPTPSHPPPSAPINATRTNRTKARGRHHHNHSVTSGTGDTLLLSVSLLVALFSL